MAFFKQKRNQGIFSFFVMAILVFFFSVSVHGFLNSSNVKEKNFEDEYGAVILGSSNGAHGFGHIALLMKTEEGWFYFSWQSTKVVFTKVPDYALSSLESFNEWIDEESSVQNYIHDFDSAFYFSGNFSGSVAKAEELFEDYLETHSLNLKEDKLSRNSDYNLFFKNCVSATYDVLKKGVVNDKKIKEIIEAPSFIAVIAEKQLKSLLKESNFFY